jgi:hypothetical protein
MANSKSTLSVAIGTAFCASMAIAPDTQAAGNPFAMQSLGSGYMVAEMGKGMKGMDGKCGGMMKKGAASAPADCKAGMDMMGMGKDGKISKEEFMKAHEARFDAMDANKDGVIDADEMKATPAPAGAKKATDGKCADMKM